MAMVLITAAVRPETPHIPSAKYTPAKVSALSTSETSTTWRSCLMRLVSIDSPSRYRISASATSTTMRDCARPASLMTPSTFGPATKPTTMNPVMLGSQRQRCAI